MHNESCGRKEKCPQGISSKKIIQKREIIQRVGWQDGQI